MKRLFLICIYFVFVFNAIHAQTIQDAQKEIDRENYYKAKQILFGLLKDANSNKAEVAYYLGNAYLKSDDADSAKVFYKQVFNNDTRAALGYVANGRLSLINGNKVEAKQHFDRALQTSKSRNANIFFEIGDAYLRPEVIDVQVAISNLEQAFNLDNKNVAIVLGLADAYNANSANDNTMGGKAMNKYEYASELDKNNVLSYIKQGRIWVNGKVYNSAIENFNKALSLDPNYAIVYKELAEAYYLSKQYDKVKPNFEKYLALSPGDIQARTTLASLFFQAKEYDKAIEESAKGLKDDPQNFIFQRIVMYANYELKRYKDAYEASNKFWELPGKKIKNSDYLYSARIAAQMGDTTAASKFFDIVLQTDSNNCDVIGEFAKSNFLSKKYEQAVVQYNRKKSICGSKFTNVDMFYLGRSYLNISDSTNADALFAEYIEKYPNLTDGYYWRAQVNVKHRMTGKDFGGAYPYYQKFIELAEKNVQANKAKLIEAYEYSAIYKAEIDKDMAGAKAYLGKALELDPNDAMAIELMKQFN